MTKPQEKAQAQVKQMVGQMIGDDRLTQEGRKQQQKANQNEDERLENMERPETVSSQEQQRDPERRKAHTRE